MPELSSLLVGSPATEAPPCDSGVQMHRRLKQPEAEAHWQHRGDFIANWAEIEFENVNPKQGRAGAQFRAGRSSVPQCGNVHAGIAQMPTFGAEHVDCLGR